MAGGVIAAGGACSLLVRDGWTTGFTLDHALMPVMVGLTILSGHLFWQAVRDWRAFSAIGFAVLAIVGSTLTIYETMGRRAELRDTKVAAAVAANVVIEEKRAELAKATARLEEAENMVKREMTGERCGKRCQDWKVRASEVEAKLEKLSREIAETGGERPVDAKAERAAAVAAILLPDVPEVRVKATVGLLEPFALPMFLELGSIVLFGFGLGRREVTKGTKVTATTIPAQDTAQTSFDVSDLSALPSPAMFAGPLPEPPAPKKKRSKRMARKERAIEALREYTLKNGAPPSFKLVQTRYHLPKATASRWRQEAMSKVA
jgi:hypothetical protein